jgi:hypothetical protein
MSTLNTCTSTTRPVSPSDGDVLYETDTYKTIISYNSVWREYTSSNSPYDLDDGQGNGATSHHSLSVRPYAHWDAAKINGSDSSGNPSNAGSASTWTSRVGSNVGIQNASTDMPVWYASGANSQPYLELNADYFILKENFGVPVDGEFTMFWVAYHNNKFAPMGRAYDGSAGWLFYWGGNTIYSYHGLGGGAFTADFSAGEDTDSAWFFTRERTGGSGYGDTSTTNSSFISLGGNSTLSATSSVDSVIDLTDIGRSGATFNSAGKLYELFWFNSHLSNTDLNALGAYVASRYSVSWTDF